MGDTPSKEQQSEDYNLKEADIVKEMLLKQQARYLKDWRDRWLVLTEWHLIKYKEKRAPGVKPLKVYQLYKIKSFTIEGDNIMKMVYEDREILFQGTNDAIEWCRALWKQMEKAKEVGKCHTKK